MSAKIVRRMLKLGLSDDAPVTAFIKEVLIRTEQHMSQKWTQTQTRDTGALDLVRLCSLQFNQDNTIALPTLDGFLTRMLSRETFTDCQIFSPPPGLENFTADMLPVSGLWTTTEYMI